MEYGRGPGLSCCCEPAASGVEPAQCGCTSPPAERMINGNVFIYVKTYYSIV